MPDAAFVPLHEPLLLDAVQLVGELVADHVRVVLPELAAMVLGEAVRLTTGGLGITRIDAESSRESEPFVHEIAKT